jgi:hypothetical protein
MSHERQEWPITARNGEEEIGSQWTGRRKAVIPGQEKEL